MRLSIKNRMQLLGALATLPFILYFIGTSVVAMNHAEARVRDDLHTKVTHVTEKIENLVEDTRNLLAATSRTITTSGASQDIDSYLRKVNAEFPQYHNISVSDASGRLIYSALDITAYHKTTMRDRPWFRDLMRTGRFTTGVYFVGRVTGKPSIPFLYPVLSSDGRVTKIVQASINIDWLNRQILRHRLERGETMVVIDSAGTVVCSNEPATYVPGTPFREASLFRTVGGSREGSGTYRFADGVERIVAYGTVKGASSPLCVLYGIPAASALADAKKALARDFMLVVVAIVVSLLVSRQVGRFLINKPIESLSQAVTRLSGGDLGARTGIERNDEIGTLALAFDEMVEVLASRDAHQQELHRKARIDASLAELYPLVVNSGVSFDEIASRVLQHAVDLTGSEVAFVSIIDPTTRWARSIAFLEPNSESREYRTRKSVFLEPGLDGKYTGLRGHALDTVVPFFTNDYLSHPGSTGIPSGHFEIRGFMSVPVSLEGKVAGQIALANPAADYAEYDLEAISRLAELYAFAIQRIRADEAIVEYQRQLKNMITETTLTQERERRQIATILHDEIGQSLALARIKLGALERGASPDNRDTLTDVRTLVSDTIDLSRSLTFEISPPVLYQAGLLAALESLAETFRNCHGLPVVFRREAFTAVQLDEELSILMYHSTRELLMNVLKHAEATSVILACYQGNNEIRISVSDDGNGIPLTQQSKVGHGFGLFSIRERLSLLNGKMLIESAPVSGTTVTLHVPLNPAA